jgi:hypothetical protein
VAYLKNENGEIIVDAILTKYGRDKLSKQGNLGITKFSLSDDEIDYALYNINNLGSEYYDIAIRELPVLEALPGNDVAMKYHLFTDTNQNISTISSLTAAYPAAFTTGISTTKISYAITPILTPQPTNYKDVYYVAQLTDTAGTIYSLNGIIDPTIGITNQIALTRQELTPKVNTINANTINAMTILPVPIPSNAVNIVYAVGHSFTFTLLSSPRYTRVFPVKITAYGPVNTNSFSFNITINGIYSISAG